MIESARDAQKIEVKDGSKYLAGQSLTYSLRGGIFLKMKDVSIPMQSVRIERNDTVRWTTGMMRSENLDLNPTLWITRAGETTETPYTVDPAVINTIKQAITEGQFREDPRVNPDGEPGEDRVNNLVHEGGVPRCTDSGRRAVELGIYAAQQNAATRVKIVEDWLATTPSTKDK